MDQVCADVWVLIAEQLDWPDVARLVCGTSRALRDVLVDSLARRHFPGVTASAATFGAACQIMQVHHTKREPLLRLLGADVRVFARRRDQHGNKIDDEFRLYSVRIVDFAYGMYRYSKGAHVVGEICMSDVYMDRVFVVAPHVLPDWDETRDNFDDDGARMRMVRMRPFFTDGSQAALLGDLRPVFGFLDEGNVIARSCQCVVINPRLR